MTCGIIAPEAWFCCEESTSEVGHHFLIPLWDAHFRMILLNIGVELCDMHEGGEFLGEVARSAEGNVFRDVDVHVGTRPRLRLRRSKRPAWSRHFATSELTRRVHWL